MGAVGTAADNSMMESFWGRMQVELFNRKKWKTRIELATAIHDYIELWHNTRRRHSALGMRTPAEIEDRWLKSQEERLSPKTGPNRSADERLAAGLSGTQVGIRHPHQNLLLNNNKAA
jgi:Integrase core domain